MSEERLFKYVSSGFKKSAKDGTVRFRRIEDLVGGTIRFSQPDTLNDPFEMERFREQQTEEATPQLMEAPAKATADIMAQLMAHPTESPLEASIKARDALLGASMEFVKKLGGGFPAASAMRDVPSARESASRTPLSAEEIEELKQQAMKIKNTMNTYGILSLTRHIDDLLMWAHYAEEHRGAVFEIDINDRAFCDGFTAHADPSEKINEWREVVRYQTERARPAISKEELIASFFLKSPQWEYEDEYRIVRPLATAIKIEKKDDDGLVIKDNDGRPLPALDPSGHEILLFPLPASSIKSLTFGARSAEGERAEARHAIAQMVRTRPELSHIDLQEARLSLDAYGLEIRPFGD